MSIFLRCDLGDLPLLSGGLSVPLRGNWCASVTTHLPDGAAALPELSPASLVFTREDRTEDIFTGAIRRSEVADGAAVLMATIVGGRGLLLADLPPRDLAPAVTEIPGGLAARAILDDTGPDGARELLADGIEAALDALPVRRWTRFAGCAAQALDLLADVLGVGWRVLPSGRVWLGAETWPELEGAEKRLAPDLADGSEVWATDGAPLLPGVTLSGRRVVEVVYSLDGGRLRASARHAVAGDPPRRPDLELYARTWAATVVSQSTAGLLEVVPDDPRLGDRARPLRGVPLRCGIPGARITYATPAGERVRLAFEGADPRQLYALPAHDQAAPGATVRGVARQGEPVAIGTLSGTCGGVPVVFTFTPSPIVGGSATTGSDADLAGAITTGSPEVKIRWP